jgi:hypothetical protein
MKLSDMTQDIWNRMTPAEKEIMRDLSGLTPQLCGLAGKRVEVVTTYGETRRFIVGRSTGWRPCHLEIKTRRSSGGNAAEKTYASVRIVWGAR